ncbi:MAG: VOC family protein [Acidobacteriaceae bacterium]
MLKNRSVPTNTVLPHILYSDVAEAAAWLTRVFGFREHYHYGDAAGSISGAQMHLGDARIMLKRAPAGCSVPADLGYGTQSLTIVVDDVEGHFQRVKLEGATIVENLHETIYGELQFGVIDLDGHHWLFSRHAHDRSPEEWGATVVEK